jgi:hypothetical protein
VRFVVFLACLVACGAAAAEDAPFAHEKPLTSPRGTFSIHQQRDGNWTTTIHFARGAHPNFTLTDDYPWPGLFYISPDDRWILHIQKSGSGDNISFLLRVDSEGRFWRMEPGVGELAFAFLKQKALADSKDLYHTGISFDAWDLPRHRLLFTVHGSRVEHSGEGIDIPLVYDLQRNTFQRR